MVIPVPRTNRRVKKGSGIKFHRFPLQNKELCAKWIADEM